MCNMDRYLPGAFPYVPIHLAEWKLASCRHHGCSGISGHLSLSLLRRQRKFKSVSHHSYRIKKILGNSSLSPSGLFVKEMYQAVVQKTIGSYLKFTCRHQGYLLRMYTKVRHPPITPCRHQGYLLR